MGYEYQVDVGGTMYGMEDIQSVRIQQPLFDKLSAGNACAAELSMSFWPTVPIPKMARIVPYVREAGTSLYHQLGVFYVDTRSRRHDLVSLTAYDAMLKAEIVWVPEQSLVFPMTMANAVKEITRLMEIEVDARTVLNASYTVDYPANDYTLRDVLCYIAAAHAGNWVITAAGKLLLIPLFASLPPETYYLVTEEGDAITFGGVRILV